MGAGVRRSVGESIVGCGFDRLLRCEQDVIELGARGRSEGIPTMRQ